jgi:DNA-3-methyladenine glycosylase II
MPTTRSARLSLTHVQAAALVRFDSSQNEVVEPSPTVTDASVIPSPVVTRVTRAGSKRKTGGENADASGSASTPKPKRARKGKLEASREASPGKSILKPVSFETDTRGLSLDPPAVPAPPSPSDAQPATPLEAPPVTLVPPAPQALVPAELAFDFAQAKRHLIAADKRFEEVFKRLKCRPYEDLTRIDPFRTLTQSILYVLVLPFC